MRSGRYEFHSATMVDLISTAYKVDPDKVTGGPSWVEMERFDVIAKVNGKPSAEVLRLMLQALLADRFKLVVKMEVKPMPAYQMTVPKKLNLKQADSAGDSDCPMSIQMGPRIGDGPPQPTLAFTCRGMTMNAFANQVRVMRPALPNLPVIDKTGIEGIWDIDFKLPMDPTGGMAALSEELEKRLGLKLELSTAPLEVIAVTRVNLKPTPDPPGAAEWQKLTDPPTEFEVADIKPTSPDFKGMRVQFPPGGRVDFKGVTLGFLMQQAFELTAAEQVIGAPSWFATDHYDIIAKAPATANHADLSRFASMNRAGPTVDSELTSAMIRTLLKDRFKLEMHREKRTLSAYTLTAVKPKLKQADPESRARMATAPMDAKGTETRLIQYDFQNVTMAQFAARLQSLGRSLFPSPVLDATGLEGAYDFSIVFSPALTVNGGRGAPVMRTPGADPGNRDAPLGASDPVGGISLPDAIEKLGLKLVMQKRPVSVWVIDHIERKPTEN